VFSDVYIALVQAAEKGGLLDKILLRLANTLEKNEDLKKHIRSALFYPMIIVVGVIAVVAIMNIFVIPQLATLYQNLDLSLPLPTQIVLGISDITKRLYPLFIALGVGGYFLYKRFARTENGKKTIDKVKLKLPVFGEIIVLSILDNISRTISLLISAGAPVLETLHIAAGVSGNIWYEQALKTAAIQVEKGAPLSTAFENTGMFPVVLIQMAKVGESTGKLDESLEKVAEYFERDLDLKIKTLTTSIEPILIIVLGIAVAFLIISVITPIYSLISQIQ
jgi:type IV pilus assembly protein PilC